MNANRYRALSRSLDEGLVAHFRKLDLCFGGFFAAMFIILMVVIGLSGCATRPVPVTPTPVEMPALPAPLNQRAEPLPPLVATDLHGMIRESIATDRAYNEVRDRLNALITAYECVRVAMLDGNDGRECFSQ